MSRRFLLVCNADDPWQKTCHEIVSSMGKLQVCSELDVCALAQEESYDCVIVDATEMTSVARMVADVQFHLPKSKIIVVDALPTWENVRDALLAGADDYASKNNDHAQLSKVFGDPPDKPPTVAEGESN